MTSPEAFAWSIVRVYALPLPLTGPVGLTLLFWDCWYISCWGGRGCLGWNGTRGLAGPHTTCFSYPAGTDTTSQGICWLWGHCLTRCSRNPHTKHKLWANLQLSIVFPVLWEYLHTAILTRDGTATWCFRGVTPICFAGASPLVCPIERLSTHRSAQSSAWVLLPSSN